MSVNRVPNSYGWRCATCGGPPEAFWSLRCSTCQTSILACAACHTREVAGEVLEGHRLTCTAKPADPVPSLSSALFRPAAQAGGQLGFAARGQRGAAIGTAAGAVLGALADHILKKPEVQPAARLARGIYDVLTDARRYLIKRD